MNVYPMFKEDRYWNFIPRISQLIESKGPIDRLDFDLVAVDEAIEKRYKTTINHSYFLQEVDKLWIVPTGYCEGGCTYCSVKDNWKYDSYLTPETLEKALDVNNITDLKQVYILGGEPVANLPAFKKMVMYIRNRFNKCQIAATTSLFYSDEIFLEFLDFCLVSNTDFAVSFDPKDGEFYSRRYLKNDTFQFLLDRIDIILKKRDRVALRATITKGNVDIFNAIKHIDQRKLSILIEPAKYNLKLMPTKEEMGLLKEKAQDYLKLYLTDKNIEWYKVPAPFNFMIQNNILSNIVKGCDMGKNRLTVYWDGKVNLCPEEDFDNVHKKIYVKNRDDLEFAYHAGFKSCQTCDINGICHGSCARGMRENEASMEAFCDWQRFCAIEGMKIRVFRNTQEELRELSKLNMEFFGLSHAVLR